MADRVGGRMAVSRPWLPPFPAGPHAPSKHFLLFSNRFYNFPLSRQDIVMPPMTNPDDPVTYSPLHVTLWKKRKRTKVLFFSGEGAAAGRALGGRGKARRAAP